MKAEQRELYVYTKDHFIEQLEKISPDCVSPLICVRKIVRTAIYQYVNDYCTKDTNAEDIFSQDDFLSVSDIICNEIKEV